MRIGIVLAMSEAVGDVSMGEQTYGGDLSMSLSGVLPEPAESNPREMKLEEFRGDEIPVGQTTIGRHRCDIIVPACYQNVSRRHAKFTREGDVVKVEDLGSTFGTFVNEQIITEATVVVPGDIIRFSTLEREYAQYRVVELV